MVKNPPVNTGDMIHGLDLWVGKIPSLRVWQPTPVFLPGEYHVTTSDPMVTMDTTEVT